MKEFEMKIHMQISFLLFALLAGCASTQKVVYVPTPVKCPRANIPAEQHYPVYDLTDADKLHPDNVMKAYAVSLKMCVGKNKVMRKQLEGYRNE
jgi:hypothetical protein